MKTRRAFTGKGPRRSPYAPLGLQGPVFYDVRVGDRIRMKRTGATGIILARRKPERDGWTVAWDNPVFGATQGRAIAAEIVPICPESAPAFKMIAPGDYETDDGAFRLVKLDGGATQAWNVELTADFENYLMRTQSGWQGVPAYMVDGARTRADALALFGDWWAENGHPAPGWRKS